MAEAYVYILSLNIIRAADIGIIVRIFIVADVV